MFQRRNELNIPTSSTNFKLQSAPNSPSTAADIHHCKPTVSFHRSLKWAGACELLPVCFRCCHFDLGASSWGLCSVVTPTGITMNKSWDCQFKYSQGVEPLVSLCRAHFTTFKVSHPDYLPFWLIMTHWHCCMCMKISIIWLSEQSPIQSPSSQHLLWCEIPPRPCFPPSSPHFNFDPFVLLSEPRCPLNVPWRGQIKKERQERQTAGEGGEGQGRKREGVAPVIYGFS